MRAALKSELRGEDIHFEPRTLIVPLYHKIRLPVETMMKVMVELNRCFASAVKLAAPPHLVTLPKTIVWDIEMADNARYKAEVRADVSPHSGTRSDLLRRDLPRHIWRVPRDVGMDQSSTCFLTRQIFFNGAT